MSASPESLGSVAPQAPPGPPLWGTPTIPDTQHLGSSLGDSALGCLFFKNLKKKVQRSQVGLAICYFTPSAFKQYLTEISPMIWFELIILYAALGHEGARPAGF